jgi:hypothetical protein
MKIVNKIPIFFENNEFNYLLDFLKKYSIEYLRDKKLNIILNQSDKDVNYIGTYKISKQSYGTTYQSSWRDSTDLRSVSHTIDSIEITEDNIYATIKLLNTIPGKSVQELNEDCLILRPIFCYKNTNEIKKSILTFDIDFINPDTAA